MTETAEAKVVYRCECGKKWTFAQKDPATKRTSKCKCGRTIVVENGFIYSTKKGG